MIVGFLIAAVLVALGLAAAFYCGLIGFWLPRGERFDWLRLGRNG